MTNEVNVFLLFS